MIGEKLGSFRIEAVLGTGAMGVVYRAVHESSGKTAAVKVVGGDVAQRGKAYDRFEREAKILQQFRHPNIVRFYAVGRYQGTSYIAMEFIPGGTLEQRLHERGPLPWREVVDLGIQICEALHYAHQHGVVHRDLKPSNLMVNDKGQVKLTDFGIAKDLDATALTGTGRTLGTAAYMAPEQIRGTPAVSHKTDLYALGVLLYQLLTGRTPFEGPTAVVLMNSHLNESPPRPSAKVAEIPRALDDLILKLMAKSPTDRPWDAAAVAYTLTELRDKASRAEPIAMVWPTQGETIDAPSSAIATQTARKTRKRAKSTRETAFAGIERAHLEIAGLVLALVVLGAGIGYLLWPPGADYLFRHAEALMASNRYADWVTARDRYIEPLNRRFPGHKYRDQTAAWVDRILLADAERRALKLDSPVRTQLTEPQTEAEHQYVQFSKLARETTEQGETLAAVRQWRELANLLKPDDPDQRPWYLLASKRADDLEQAAVTRRKAVITQLQLAAQKEQAGLVAEATAIRQNLRKEYGRYKDLADLFPQEPPAPEAPEAEPEAAPKGQGPGT